MNVWLFGDSYSATDLYTDKRIVTLDMPYEEHWPIKLSQSHYVKNFSASGSGPDYQIKLLKEEMAKVGPKQTKQIKVIFFVSHSCRKDFTFWHYPGDAAFSSVMAQDGEGLSEEDSRMDQYAQHKNFVRDFFKYYEDKHDSFFQNLLELKQYADLFDSMLVVPIFETLSNHILYKRFGNILQQTDKFSMAKGQPLFDALGGEDNHWYPNHSRPEMHKYIFTNLNQWLHNKTHIFNTNNLG